MAVHAYRVYYGVGQRRPLVVGNACVMTALTAPAARVCPSACPRPGLAVRVLLVPRVLAASADHRGRCCFCLLAQLLRLQRARSWRFRALRPQTRLHQRCVRLSLSVCLSACLCAHV